MGKRHHCCITKAPKANLLFFSCPFVTPGSWRLLSVFVWTHGAQRSLQRLPTATNGYGYRGVYPTQMSRLIETLETLLCSTNEFQAVRDPQNLYTAVSRRHSLCIHSCESSNQNVFRPFLGYWVFFWLSKSWKPPCCRNVQQSRGWSAENRSEEREKERETQSRLKPSL